MRQTQGFLVIADISGYTKFVRSHNLRKVPLLGKKMRTTSDEHAETVITDLLEVIIDTVGSSMTVNKLEGDAVFFVKESEQPDEDVSSVIPRLLQVFDAFQRRLYDLIYCQVCLCDCCQQMGELKVKLVVHFGSFYVKQVAHFEEVAGEEVILVHRLLKNELNSDEYLMVTPKVQQLARQELAHLEFAEHREITDLGVIDLAVHLPNSEGVILTPSVPQWLSRMQKMRAYFAQPRSRQTLEESLFF